MEHYSIRARILPNGQVELIDPLPEDFDHEQVVTIQLGEYISTNAFNEAVIVDPVHGIERPLQPPTHDDFTEFFGLWSNRSEFADSASWLRQLRSQSQRKTPPQWPTHPSS